jgi:hypothetical protein
MKFYEIDGALKEAIEAGDKAVRVRVEIGGGGVIEEDILEADFYGLKEAAGGTSARGDLLIKNEKGIMKEGKGAGREVRVEYEKIMKNEE